MTTQRFYGALALVLSIALGGCAVVPDAGTDPTGEVCGNSNPRCLAQQAGLPYC